MTRQQFDALRGAKARRGSAAAAAARRRANANPNEMRVFDRRIVVGDKQETRTEPLKEDLDGMAAVVRNASRQADYTIVVLTRMRAAPTATPRPSSS